MARPVQAFLEISTGGWAPPRKFALRDDVRVYTIGRIYTGAGSAPANLIPTEGQAVAVAPQHARLYLDDRDPTVPVWRFEDLQSPNGSYRNNQRIRGGAPALDDGDELWLGPVGNPTSVRLIYHDPLERPPLKRWLLQPGPPNPVQVGREVGPGHLKLFSDTASDHHATIAKVPASGGTNYVLSDAGSANGTYVNNVRLGPNESRTIQRGDLLRFGSSQYTARQLDPHRMMLLPLGLGADQHVAAVGLRRSVTLEANTWMSQYLRYARRRVFNPSSAKRYKVDLTPPQRTKVLLQDVDVVIGPNDFVVLAGSSGSGKTTLLYALTTIAKPQQGQLFYKGWPYKERPELFRPHIGYVPQDDIIHESLTVFEELMFAAQLRLPPSFTDEAREARVHAVIKQLRLVPQARQRINRLSGGQRKRVSLAVELLSRPGVLFLDEPTEGQDLALEQSLIALLRNLANDGTSIVLITHRLNFVDYADYVGWLAPGGHLAFFGPPDDLAPYFNIDPDLPPGRRYAAIYDQLEQEPNPAALAVQFKRSPLYRQHIQSRIDYRAVLAFERGGMAQPVLLPQNPVSTNGPQVAPHQSPVSTPPAPPPGPVAQPAPPRPPTAQPPPPAPPAPSNPQSNGPRRPPPPPPKRTLAQAAPAQGQPVSQIRIAAPPRGQRAGVPPPPTPVTPTQPGKAPPPTPQPYRVPAPAPAPAPVGAPTAARPPRTLMPPPMVPGTVPVGGMITGPQFHTLLRRARAIAFSDWIFMILVIIQPIIIGLLLGAISDPHMFDQVHVPDRAELVQRIANLQPGQFDAFEADIQKVQNANGLMQQAETILFALSVSAVYLGVLLAVRELVKERSIYRRERMVGLRIMPYIISKVAVLSGFALYQSFVLTWLVFGRATPPPGAMILPWAPAEMFVTLFLTTFGGATLGLLISAWARTQEVLGALVPLAILPQLILSKALGIPLPSLLDPISRLMFTNWATEAMGSSAHMTKEYLAHLAQFQGNLSGACCNQSFIHVPEVSEFTTIPDFGGGALEMLGRWGALIALSALFLGLAVWRQKRQESYERMGN